MDQIMHYINDNWIRIVSYGVGGLVVVSLIVLLLRGPNGRWRWEK